MDARRPHEAQRHRGEHGRLNEKEKTKKNKKKRKKKDFFKMKECLVLYSVLIWANKKSGITTWCTAPRNTTFMLNGARGRKACAIIFLYLREQLAFLRLPDDFGDVSRESIGLVAPMQIMNTFFSAKL